MPGAPSSSTAPVLVVGTGNAHKVHEIREMLRDVALEIRAATTLGRLPDVKETGATFEENARIKALGFARVAGPTLKRRSDTTPVLVLADDSGLCVDALDGRPGVHSARYASGPGNKNDGSGAGDSSDANNRKLLRELAEVPEDRRGARFVCVVAIAEVPPPGPGEQARVLFTARGECHGRIATEPRGTGGFGYDPLFVVAELERTFAELDAGDKNRISHRARALEALRGRLAELIAP